MDFYPTQVTGSGAGSDAEEEVWNALRKALGPADNGVAYYRYPVIDKAGERFDREPDILLLHEDCGLMVIEVKGYQIHHIDRIEGQTWYLSGTSQSTATPYSQARDQGFFVQSWFKREPQLRNESEQCKIPVNFTVALPNITQEEWEEAGLAQTPSTPRAITADDLSPQSFREHILEEPGATDEIGPEEIEAASAVLSGATVISGSRTPPPPDPTTKGELYETLLNGLKRFDETQETIGSEIPPGPQRIRGIAGSGKTVLIAKKAAHIHSKRPKADIVLTFYTQSLKDELSELVAHFHRMMTETEPDWDKLQIMHGWGGKTVGDGVYYNICQETNLNPRNAKSAKRIASSSAPPNKLEASCRELVQEADIPRLFDVILIDEGQDFGKWFYRMCYDALREPDEGQRQLIWAYDEAQTLSDLGIPTSREIFGEDKDGNPRVNLAGSYSNGIQKSRIMRQSYRSPREVIMLAHAFGMGVQRKDGPLDAAITNQDTWGKIGYEVEGDFVSDKDATLARPDEYSPHPLQYEPEAKPAVRFEGFQDKEAEIQHVAEQIVRDIEEHNLEPTNVLVIPLGKPNFGESVGHELSDILQAEGIAPNMTWIGSADVFKRPSEVTISRINRAKGNEAAQVYLMNIDEVENTSRFRPLFTRRNQAFVGITRARAWCTLTGLTDEGPVSNELGPLIDEITADQEFTFPVENMPGEGTSDEPDTTLDEFNLIGRE